MCVGENVAGTRVARLAEVMRVNRRAKVGINACIVGERPTGRGIYSIHLVRSLDQVRDDLLVYTSHPLTLSGLRARIGRVTPLVRPERGLGGHLMRSVWLQSALRILARRDRVGMLLNTVPEGIVGGSIPQVTVVHDLLPLLFPAEYPRQQYYFRLVVPRLLRASRVVVADSESTRRSIIRHFGLPPGKVRVIYPGYDSSVFCRNGFDRSRPRDVVPYLLYVGNLLPHKNLLRLLDALAILRRRQPCQLIIRGEGRSAYRRTLQERVETLGLGDVVTFLGYTAGERLRELYAHAACVLLPSLGEGFGLPVLEAMSCGTPVITSNTSSLPEVAGEATLMVDPYDAIALAEAIYRVLTDRDLGEDLRQRGLRRASAFTWRRTAEQMSRLLDEVRNGETSGSSSPPPIRTAAASP